MNDALYYREPKQQWLKMDGRVYVWRTNIGWSLTSEEKAPDASLFRTPHENQLFAILAGLRAQELID